MLRNYITGSYHGIILRHDIMELYYGIIFIKWGWLGRPRSPLGSQGFPGRAPGAPRGRSWNPKARPWDPPRISLRAPGHAPGNPRGPPKATIDQQIYSARSSRLLCPNLLVGTYRLKDSPGPLCLYKDRQNQKYTLPVQGFPGGGYS